MTTVLLVAANPAATSRLGLDEEARAIQDRLRGTTFQQSIDLRAAWAARPGDLLRALNEFRPDVLHFSGHGDADGRLLFVDDGGSPHPVTERALTTVLRSAGETVRLVVLNACYSLRQAEAVIAAVPCAIGMNTSIGDPAAIVFAAAFYQAIGFGHSVRRAFDQAVAALLLANIPEDATPELIFAAGTDPAELRLAGGARLEMVDFDLVDDSRYVLTRADGIVRIALRGR